jgi:hypothetical protein
MDINLNGIKSLKFTPSPSEDTLTKKEEKDWNHEDKKADIKDKNANRHLKIGFAIAVFFLVLYWIYEVLKIISLQGNQTDSFYLSNSVLITLLTTTSINIFGYLLIVLKYLFNNKKNH